MLAAKSHHTTSITQTSGVTPHWKSPVVGDTNTDDTFVDLENQQEQEQRIVADEDHEDRECPWEESAGSIVTEDVKLDARQTTMEDPGIDVSALRPAASPPGYLRGAMRCYYELWKTRLSSLVLFTTMGAYYSDGGWQQSWQEQTALAVGTFLQAACANRCVTCVCVHHACNNNNNMYVHHTCNNLTQYTFYKTIIISTNFIYICIWQRNSLNQIYEVELDSKMNRTKSRPLPTGRITRKHAIAQAVVVGSLGTYLLYRYNNPKTALLGAANIAIYVAMYTPMKVRHWFNTWVGTITGSLPPLMGCAAATNSITSPTAIYNGGLLYFWQIAHFMAIGYKCKGDYGKAGYKMLPIDQPRHAAIQTVAHAALLFPLCWYMGPWGFNVAPWWFVGVSTAVNYHLLFKPAVVFYRNINYDNATKLFFRSLGHLSVLFLAGVAAWCTKDVSWVELFSDKISALAQCVTNVFRRT